MKGEIEGIEAIINKFLLRKGIQRKLDFKLIKNILTNVFNEQELSQLSIYKIHNDKLFLNFRSSSLLYDAKCFRKNKLNKLICNNFELSIKEIIFLLDYKE